jgi:hypothetical protein
LDWNNETDHPHLLHGDCGKSFCGGMTRADGLHWQFSVNGKREVVVPCAHFTNLLSRLQLRHGDVVLWERPSSFESSRADDCIQWLLRYCGSNKVAVYVHPKPPVPGGIFSMPVYHWVAPYSNPLDLTNAAFFIDGRCLGAGMDGFLQLLKLVEHTRSRQIFIIGSLYDWDLGLGALEAPYEKQQHLLDRTLTKSGTELLLPSQLPGF